MSSALHEKLWGSAIRNNYRSLERDAFHNQNCLFQQALSRVNKKIPLEVAKKVMNYLEPKDLLNLSLVNKPTSLVIKTTFGKEYYLNLASSSISQRFHHIAFHEKGPISSRWWVFDMYDNEYTWDIPLNIDTKESLYLYKDKYKDSSKIKDFLQDIYNNPVTIKLTPIIVWNTFNDVQKENIFKRCSRNLRVDEHLHPMDVEHFTRLKSDFKKIGKNDLENIVYLMIVASKLLEGMQHPNKSYDVGKERLYIVKKQDITELREVAVRASGKDETYFTSKLSAISNGYDKSKKFFIWLSKPDNYIEW